MEESSFVRLAKINVNDKIEKKNGLSYLSWAWAWDFLQREDPNSEYEYPEPDYHGETMMVYCKVTAFGKSRTAHLPVMDYKNQPIKNPTAFQVNTAMQRCLVKAIALHGLGLYIYAGEDLPEGAETPQEAPVKPASFKSVPQEDWNAADPETKNGLLQTAAIVLEYMEMDDDAGAIKFIDSKGFDATEKSALWSRFDSKQRARLKKAGEALREHA